MLYVCVQCNWILVWLTTHTSNYYKFSIIKMCVYLLQGSDPSTFEMIQKIHALQRRLIQKTEEVRGKKTVCSSCCGTQKQIIMLAVVWVSSYKSACSSEQLNHADIFLLMVLSSVGRYFLLTVLSFIGCREGTTHSREREVVHGTETDSSKTTRTWSCWTATNLPANTQRQDKADEGST